MRIARLSHRVEIQSAVDTQSSTGAPETAWVPFATVYAEILPMGARESQIGGGILSEVDTKITVRWAPALAALSAKSRVVHRADGRPAVIYNIIGPIEPGLARGMLELRCKSGTNEG
jgi:head-tail adaptor